MSGAIQRWPFLARLSLFEGIDATELQDLEAALVTVHLTPGERPATAAVDPIDGQGLAVLVSGSLRLVGPSGPDSVSGQALLVSGNVFAGGGMPVCLPAPLEAVAPTDVLLIPRARLEALQERWPALRGRIVAEITRHLGRLALASTPLFRSLDDTWLSHIADQAEFVDVRRGDIIMREGSEPDCLYVVVRGSLELFRDSDVGAARVTAILSAGSSVGEMGVLLKEPRSLSVRARRDSTLIRVPAGIFNEVLHQNAPVALHLASILSERLKRTTMEWHRPVPMTTIALFRACEAPIFTAFCQRLLHAFERAGRRVASLSSSALSADQDDTVVDSRLSAALDNLERTHDYVLCVCDRAAPEWTKWAVLQADRILVVGELTGGPPTDWPSEFNQAASRGTRIEIALMRRAGTEPSGTAGWLEGGVFQAHHHVVIDSVADHERVVRRLSGTAWGLVLGGGGARGFAHIGVIRALRESGMPIDMICGTSMGAILAAQYAMGCDDQQMLEMTRRAYVSGPRSRDVTVPLVSLHTGRDTVRRLKAMFGDRAIEDLPTGYFCVSCNLTRAEAGVHERGPVWLWVRVSCSVPGLLPPVPCGGDMLVDGGLLDNLPVGEMRRRLGGLVAASDVGVEVDLTVDSTLQPHGPWSGMSQVIRMLTGRPRLPNIGTVLMRAAEIASVRDAKVSGSPANLYLHVPVQGFAMSDFHAIDRLVALGYEYTARRLEEPSCPRWAPGLT